MNVDNVNHQNSITEQLQLAAKNSTKTALSFAGRMTGIKDAYDGYSKIRAKKYHDCCLPLLKAATKISLCCVVVLLGRSLMKFVTATENSSTLYPCLNRCIIGECSKNPGTFSLSNCESSLNEALHSLHEPTKPWKELEMFHLCTEPNHPSCKNIYRAMNSNLTSWMKAGLQPENLEQFRESNVNPINIFGRLVSYAQQNSLNLTSLTEPCKEALAQNSISFESNLQRTLCSLFPESILVLCPVCSDK